MPTVRDISEFLEAFAPSHLAEDWDNVGLLLGDAKQSVSRVMTCLTVTPATASEARRESVDLIVSHHPLPFRPLKRITTETVPGRLLLELARSGAAVYSPHTSFDSAEAGINQKLAEGMELIEIEPLVPNEGASDGLGSGRWGRLPAPANLQACAARLKQFLSIEGLHLVGAPDQPIERIAVACGSAGSFLGAARDKSCDLLVTGETNFHTCLEAEATGIALLLPGHYASERFAVEMLAGTLANQFAEVEAWASRDESDPLRWM